MAEQRFGKVKRNDDSGGFEIMCILPECSFSYEIGIDEGGPVLTSLDELFRDRSASEVFALLMQHGLDVHGIASGEEIVP